MTNGALILLLLLSEGGLWGRGPGEGYLPKSWSALFLISVSHVGCWVLVVMCLYCTDCLLYLLVVVVGCWLSGIGCHALNVDCRVLLSVVVVGFWLFSVIG